jgi:UrcA family protein
MSSSNNIYPLIQEETIMTHASIRSMALASGLVTLLSVCSVGVQTARADESAPQVKVSYADLNLSSMQGAEALYRRIKNAAGEVCYPREEKNLALMATRRACIHTAMSDAVTHVGSPTLMAVYNTHDGRSQPLQVALSDNRHRE